MCLVRTDVAARRTALSRRPPATTGTSTLASGRSHEVSLPDHDSTRPPGRRGHRGGLLSQPDGDVGVEAGGRTIGTTWVGAYGVLQLVGLGILGTSLGAGLLLVALRIRRAAGSWVGHEPVRKHGSAALALPVVVGFVLWIMPRFLW